MYVSIKGFSFHECVSKIFITPNKMFQINIFMLDIKAAQFSLDFLLEIDFYLYSKHIAFIILLEFIQILT